MVAADEGALTRSAIGVFIAAASSRTRALVACIVVLAVAARLGVLGVALALGRSDAALAAVLGAVAATSFALQRVAQGSARVAAQCDLHRATARTLLDGDVLDVPTADTQRIVFDGNHHAAELLTSILPALVADLVAAGVMAPSMEGGVPL